MRRPDLGGHIDFSSGGGVSKSANQRQRCDRRASVKQNIDVDRGGVEGEWRGAEGTVVTPEW